MSNRIWTDEELEEMTYDREMLREYFQGCAGNLINMGLREGSPKNIKTGLVIMQLVDTLVESTYKPKESKGANQT